MPPHSPSGHSSATAVNRLYRAAPAPSLDTLKARIVAKLEERLDPGTSKRMPASLLRQSLLSAAEIITEQEARGLPKAERVRLVADVLAELLGYGPLEELFADLTVREIMVAGPHAVIVRYDGSEWLPSNVKYRDEDHIRAAIDRLAAHADPVGGVTTSVNLFDLKLPNGFRAVAVVPPVALGVGATLAFVRCEPAAGSAPSPAAAAESSHGSDHSGGARPPSSASVSSRPPSSQSVMTGSSSAANPTGRPLSGGLGALAYHRKQIIERLIAKLASMGIYDLHVLEVTELRRVVAAFITEYSAKEKIYISDTDQGRLQLEILTAMQR